MQLTSGQLTSGRGLPRVMLAATLLPIALAGCATTGSVKRAQASADAAMARANAAGDAAQHAQGSADAAFGAARQAQGTADGAATAAQGAGSTAQQALAAGQGADGRISALESRIRRLERRKAYEAHMRARHRHHHGAKACPVKPGK
jgi:hypothetical protein